jgi:hypothetical protein
MAAAKRHIPGARWPPVYTAVTTKAGRYVQGGGCATVGVAGLILGGYSDSLQEFCRLEFPPTVGKIDSQFNSGTTMGFLIPSSNFAILRQL